MSLNPFAIKPANRSLIAILGALIFWLNPVQNQATGSDNQATWISLFNGQDLDGWYTYLDATGKNADPDGVFQIHDGVIHICKDHADGAAAAKGYFATEAHYSHYHLRFQYKWGVKKFKPRYDMLRDAGLLYHVTGPDNVWPRCFECQVQEGDTGDGLTVRGTQLVAVVNPKPVRRGEYQLLDEASGGSAKTLGSAGNVRFIKQGVHEVEGWNTVEIIVHGDREAVHIVNGKPTFRSKKLRRLSADNQTWVPLAAGRIAFQAECAELMYRNIEIKPIEGETFRIDPKSDTTAAESVSAAPYVPGPLPQVPEGFEIQLAAAPPLVDYPTLACFDDQGRLYVSEGANVNDLYDVLEKTLPRSIRRLEDTDGDGVFDRSTVFADKMTFPYGGVWHEGALYVASDPALWRLEDTDGDGVADKREIVITGFRSEGHSACMKGGYLGPDGYMYFCGGNERGGYDLTDKDGTRLRDPQTAPCVFRMRPNGTGLEYFANGAAGVYDLCFDQSGDLFGVVTILRYPRGDGLMHWVYGGAYESSRPISRHARLTGDKLPALHEWPQTSPSGALQYQSGDFGEEYRGNIFTAHFGTHQVTRSIVQRDGATWRLAKDEVFARSDNLNCRFTDVLEDADGSLLLINTGGWFRIGCPTSQVGEGDLRGAIYRVRKKGQVARPDPRGWKVDWRRLSANDTAKLLGDERFMVSTRAIAELAQRGPSSIAALRETLRSNSATARRNAVWALTRIDATGARAAVRAALTDTELSNTLAALHSVGLRRDREAVDQLLELLRSSQAAVKREAATALGRSGDGKCVAELLDQLAQTSDRFVEQALIFAIIEIDSPEPTRAGLHSKNSKIQRGSLIALEQMAHGDIQQRDVSPLLKADDLAIQKTALWVLGRHSGWTQGLSEFLSRWLDQPELSTDQRELVVEALSGGKGSREVQQLIADKLESATVAIDIKLLLLEVMANGQTKRFPAAWESPLRKNLQSTTESVARQAIATASSLARSRFADMFAAMALDANRPIAVRIEAAIAATAGDEAPSDRVFEFLLEQCAAADTEAVSRMTIARALGNAHLTGAQLERMVRIVPVAGPLELPLLLKAYEESPEPVAGQQLFAALAKSPGLHSVSSNRIRQLVERYPKATRVAAAELLSRFGSETESQAARMKELEFALSGGDEDRGRGLFFGKAACSQCHKVDRVGSGVGPDLSQLGGIRTRRDLIEAIAFPSATFARGYEPVTVFVSGRSVSGVLTKETAKHTYILTADRSETAVPREEIEEIVPGRLSIMPQGLDRNLTPAEFRDLIAFLSSLTSKDVQPR